MRSYVVAPAKTKPSRPTPHAPRVVLIGVLGAAALLALAPQLASGQNLPPPSQAQSALQQALQQNPALAELIRQRLLESGLSPEQVRARLQASGYPSNLFDAYIGGAAPGRAQLAPGALELGAIQALGLPPIEQNLLPVDTGLIRARAGIPASRVFGVDVFRRTTTQFLPLLAGPVPPDYKLGPGDVLVLILTGDVELAYTLQVTREGFMLIPQVGQVFVSNLTLDQLRDVLYTRLGRVYSGVRRGANATTRFDISVANVRVNQVYVVGEVRQPASYQVSALGTVLSALYAAGGVTERANTRQVEVRRLGKTTATFDLYDYLLHGDTRSDIRLETGDVVFVPVHGTRAELSGAVTRPAIYELRPGESLTDLLRAAGGFRPDAQLKRLAIYRLLPAFNRGPGTPPRAVIDVQLAAVPPDSAGQGLGLTGSREQRAAGGGMREAGGVGARADPVVGGVAVPQMTLEDGDSVVVDSVEGLAGQYYVAIAGMVNKPGPYPWREGMTLRDLVLLARGPKVGADLREAEIARMPEDRSQGQLATTVRVPLDSTYLFERDSLGRYIGPPGVPFPVAGAPEVKLEPFDNVLILRQPDFEFQRTVVLLGEVWYPGTYSLRSRTERLADLIDRAGGLTPRAYPEGIRFFRKVNDVGRINIELPQALRERAARQNIILQPGDSIVIPEYQPSVKVSGAVNSPGSVLWQKGRGLDAYVSAAGGFTYKADKRRVLVRFANGEVQTKHRFLFMSSSPEPGPGSEVFVPVRDTTEHVNYVALFGSIAQTVTSILAILIVATR